jgi:hypothetical protein
MNTDLDRSTAKRFAFRFIAALIFYLLSLGSVFYFLRLHSPSQFTVVVLAVIPAAAIMAMIVAFGIFIGHLDDEFQRVILQQASIGATGCILAVTSVCGTLEMFTKLPHLPMFLIFPVFWFFFGLCAAIVRLQYGGIESHD